MSELTTEQLIKIIIGALVFVAVVIGVYLFFRFKVIDFFQGYTNEEPVGGQTGTSSEIGEETKTYKINSLGFKVENNPAFEEGTRTGMVEFIVFSEENCDAVGYQIWKEGPLNLFDNKVSEDDKISLSRVNILLNTLARGKYHVDVFCYDNTGKERDHKTSKDLEIK
ncbi:MAG: hypothetical protein Q7S06_03210 [Nanoarchaeota archaeon]|nr:hypothetical protein [Nanoarchaeota archaeon]